MRESTTSRKKTVYKEKGKKMKVKRDSEPEPPQTADPQKLE